MLSHRALRRAETAEWQFAPLGVTAEFIADFRARANTLEQAMEQAMEGQRSGRNGVTAAKVAIDGALARGIEAVQQLDVLLANAVQEDPLILALWKRNRRIDSVAKVGAVASDSTATDGTVPSSTDAEPALPSPAEPHVEPAPTSLGIVSSAGGGLRGAS